MKMKFTLIATLQIISTFGFATELLMTSQSPVPGCRKNISLGRLVSSNYLLLDLSNPRELQSYTELQGADLNKPNHCVFIIPEDTCQNSEITTAAGELKPGLQLRSIGEIITASDLTYARFSIEGTTQGQGFDFEMTCTASVSEINQKLSKTLSIQVIN